MDAFFGLYFFSAIIFGFACHTIATEKGYSGCSSFLIGAIFSVIGLLIYIGMPDKKTQLLLTEINMRLSRE